MKKRHASRETRSTHDMTGAERSVAHPIPYWQLVAGSLAILALTAGTAYQHGRLSQRWGGAIDTAQAVALVDQFPASIGPWKLRTNEPISPEAQQILQCMSSFQRTYTHEENGDTITMSLIVGPAGPTSVHDPQVCFSSQGTKQVSRENVTFGEPAAAQDASEIGVPPVKISFWSTTWQNAAATGRTFRVYHSWSRDMREWIASGQPRIEFGGAPYLYKIQVVGDLHTASNLDESRRDPARNFVEKLLASSAGFGSNFPQTGAASGLAK